MATKSTAPKTGKTMNSENPEVPVGKKSMSAEQLEKLAKAREMANAKRREIAELKKREKAIQEHELQQRIKKVEDMERQMKKPTKKAPAKARKPDEDEFPGIGELTEESEEEEEEVPDVVRKRGGNSNPLRDQYSKLMTKYKAARALLGEMSAAQAPAAAPPATPAGQKGFAMNAGQRSAAADPNARMAMLMRNVFPGC